MKIDTFENLEQKEQGEIQDKFKDLYDMFCYEDDGQLTIEFKRFVLEEIQILKLLFCKFDRLYKLQNEFVISCCILIQ